MRARKNRWSDYEPSPESNVVDLRPAGSGLKLTFTGRRGRPQNLNFSFMSDRPQMAALFAQVMRVEGERYLPRSRTNVTHAARSFNLFLGTRHREIRHTSALTGDLLREWGDWLINVRKDAPQTAAKKFSYLRTLLSGARSMYPDAFRPDFDIPVYVFLKPAKGGKDGRMLSEEVLRSLLEAAEKEVGQIRERYLDGDTPEGLAPLIPFMILIGLKTAINPESLYNIGRDCLRPHAIDTTAFYLVWTKRRSKSGLQRQLHHADPRGKGVIELIQFLIAYTQPLVEQVPEPERGMLFLYRYSSGRRCRGAFSLTQQAISREIVEFCGRNNLPAVKLSQLRPSAATQHYKKTGGKLRKVQILLGHSEISTTVRYIGDSLVQRMHNNSIRAAQDAMVKRVTTVIPKEAEQALVDLAGELAPGQREKIADGRYDTGFGKCRNPYDSPQPGQHQGRCCTLFTACLTCSNALFFLEDLPRVIALREHFLAEKKNMRPGVWEALYGDKIKVIEEDIVGAFSPTQVAEAESLAAEVTDMPLLATKGVLR